ncbi:preprotein translocase subunit SecG [Porticoccaceae bacterium LTM1]|nr:preprotein translocase subunit SecG [Porticoccaceae bacterium LTM1]
MENIILIFHVLVALAIIGLILLQQGKGAEVGASFGAGASQTIFGSSGSWNFFSKMTAIFATIFFVTSFGLAILAKEKSSPEAEILPAAEIVDEVVEQESDVPVVEEESVSEDVPEVPVEETVEQEEEK